MPRTAITPSPRRAAASSSLLATLCAAALVVAGLLAAPARGETLSTLSGNAGNGSWSDGANWSTAIDTFDTFSLVFSGTNQVSGGEVTTINDIGTVNVSSIAFVNSGTLPGSSGNAVFRINSGTLAFNNSSITTVAASGSLPFGTNSDGDWIAASITLAGTSSFVTNNNHNITVSGDISGAGALIFDDGSVGTTEYVYLSGTNTYGGGTQIKGGFAASGSRSNTSSNSTAFGTGPIAVSDNGTLLLRNNSILTNPLTVSGSGAGVNPANASALVGSFGTAGGIAEYRGNITLAGNARFATASSAANDTTSKLLVSGNVDIGPYLLTLRSRPSNSGTSTLGMLIEITGTMFGTGGIDIYGLNGQGRVLISNSNSYSGGTTISSGTLMVGNGSALGTGFLLMSSGTAGSSVLDLNDQTLSVGTLSGTTGVIRTGLSGTSKLVTTSTTDSSYSGVVVDGAGPVGLAKAGSGVLSLSGSNTYTGITNVDGGVISLDSLLAIGSSGAITFGGGTLRYSGVNQEDYSARFANSTGAISIDTNGQTVTYASAIASTNVGGLTKSGSGTLFLNAANQFAGTTTVNAGTLAGTGSVLGPLSVASGAVFDPGSGPGATTVFGAGAFTQASGGTTRMQVNGTTPGSLYDQVLFSGTAKTVTWGGTLDLTVSGSYANFTTFDLFKGFDTQSNDLAAITLTAGSPYDTLSFNGPVGGVWTTGTTTGGQTMIFNQNTGVLMVVPEPGAMTLAGLGVGACGLWLCGRRRRRVAA